MYLSVTKVDLWIMVPRHSKTKSPKSKGSCGEPREFFGILLITSNEIELFFYFVCKESFFY